MNRETAAAIATIDSAIARWLHKNSGDEWTSDFGKRAAAVLELVNARNELTIADAQARRILHGPDGSCDQGTQ